MVVRIRKLDGNTHRAVLSRGKPTYPGGSPNPMGTNQNPTPPIPATKIGTHKPGDKLVDMVNDPKVTLPVMPTKPVPKKPRPKLPPGISHGTPNVNAGPRDRMGINPPGTPQVNAPPAGTQRTPKKKIATTVKPPPRRAVRMPMVAPKRPGLDVKEAARKRIGGSRRY